MKLIAHRGYSAKYPENTLPAFEAVLKHPACGGRIAGIELDIRFTRDNAMAVFHDGKVEFDKIKVPVELISFDNLQDVAKERFKGVPVPVLDQVLDCVAHKTALYIEMKDGAYDKNAFMDSLDASLSRYKPQGDVVLHSFSPVLMKMAVERFKGRGVRFGALLGNAKDLEKFPPELLAGMDFLHPNWKALVESEEPFASKGKPFNVWTVDRPAELEALKKLKHADMIEGVISNELALLESF